MAVRLQLPVLAKKRGLTLYMLWKISHLPQPLVRRYWHNQEADGTPLETVSLSALGTLAGVLGVAVGDLLEDSTPPSHSSRL